MIDIKVPRPEILDNLKDEIVHLLFLHEGHKMNIAHLCGALEVFYGASAERYLRWALIDLQDEGKTTGMFHPAYLDPTATRENGWNGLASDFQYSILQPIKPLSGITITLTPRQVRIMNEEATREEQSSHLQPTQNNYGINILNLQWSYVVNHAKSAFGWLKGILTALKVKFLGGT